MGGKNPAKHAGIIMFTSFFTWKNKERKNKTNRETKSATTTTTTAKNRNKIKQTYKK